jgi:hypothetical protein
MLSWEVSHGVEHSGIPDDCPRLGNDAARFGMRTMVVVVMSGDMMMVRDRLWHNSRIRRMAEGRRVRRRRLKWRAETLERVRTARVKG